MIRRYQFEDELADDHTYTRGTVAMANAGRNTNGSQFFIMHADYPLPHSYSIFGYVTEGMDVVDAIAAVETGAGDRPIENIVMNKVTIEDLAQ
ncbi:MAG: Peptidyl-prolyl cis-trans isomerase [Candidatus Uhrbacteria bacterium GW2011_GWD2_52_7]|uniref:Peptidyl-prolyl cis-trans isomerase n=1 Tax=Candidatus Uhrbacteria bacterium GW2011_GWD2_52_7 TaxID=1618989 RepID=A0A0G1XHL1_9BACT|nr:MAG: Peptidyl-prolyl cis-trans isomerase [Candidatus Uhrbacteria bacterium GW2011_GWD2_52_7]